MFQACGPLWSYECGSSYYSTGICSRVNASFKFSRTIAPAFQSKVSFLFDKQSWAALNSSRGSLHLLINEHLFFHVCSHDEVLSLNVAQDVRPTWTSWSFWMVQTPSTPGMKCRLSSSTFSRSSTLDQVKFRCVADFPCGIVNAGLNLFKSILSCQSAVYASVCLSFYPHTTWHICPIFFLHIYDFMLKDLSWLLC